MYLSSFYVFIFVTSFSIYLCILVVRYKWSPFTTSLLLGQKVAPYFWENPFPPKSVFPPNKCFNTWLFVITMYFYVCFDGTINIYLPSKQNVWGHSPASLWPRRGGSQRREPPDFFFPISKK